MTKSESKYFNTALRMDEAMLTLLEKKEFEYITIKEICQKAKVNRSTFYLHYENTRELLDESISLIQNRFVSCFDSQASKLIKSLHSCTKDELIFITPKYLTPYLNFIKDNRQLYSAALKNPKNFDSENTLNKMFSHIFNPILARFQVPEPERNYIMAFYLNGIAAIITEWIRDDFNKSTSEIIKIVLRCIPTEPITKKLQNQD